jgi:PKD repeat protein
MVKGLALFSMLAVTAVMAAGCSVHDAASAPSLTGPSQFAMQVNMLANPDRISLDGGSQSLITAEVRGPNGQVQVNVPLRVDMLVNGSLQDYGKLNSRNIVTGTDGKAFAVYTAPALAAGANQPVSTVSIRAILVASDATASVTHVVDIALMPTGVILPPADTPTASFVVTPTPVSLNLAASFDASGSCPGAKNAVGCLPSSSAVITDYSWTFGDGATASGRTVSHTYAAIGTFNVTLTITNDRGVQNSTAQPVLVSATAAPTAVFVFSPAAPVVNQAVNFNAAASAAAPGRVIASYSWNFGDGGGGSGSQPSHSFTAGGTYNVTLTVTDDIGQRATALQPVFVSAVPPTAIFTVSPPSPGINQTVNFNAGQSTPAAGRTIVSYIWNFGDGTPLGSGVTVAHAFGTAGVYSVALTVTDDVGQHATSVTSVTVTAVTGGVFASFTYSPTGPTVITQVNFNASSSTGPVARYDWDFGDGSMPNPVSGPSPLTNHKFVLPGTYVVRLTVSDAPVGGHTNSTTQNVTIGP